MGDQNVVRVVNYVRNYCKKMRSQLVRITVEDVEDVEAVKEPFSVTYKLLVHSAKGNHGLNKSYKDLERMGEALTVELPTGMLPRLPRPLAHEQLVDRGFITRLGAYLICLACNQNVVETFTFNNFFQLAQDAQQRWQLVCLTMQRRRAHTSTGNSPMRGPVGMGGSSNTVGPVASPTAQAAAQAPVDSRATQGPTSLSEPSANPAIVRPKRIKTTKSRAWCVVCLERPHEMAIDPCGHMSMCEECMKSVKDCPICRGPIHKAMKIIVAKRHPSGEATEYVTK